MSSFRDEIDDLKYFISKDYRSQGNKEKANCRMYRILVVAWILMLVNIIPLVLTWTVFRARVPMGLLTIYSVISLVLVLCGIGAWFIVTKK